MLTYLYWPEPISDRYDKQQEEPPAMFEFNEPYEESDPQAIRADFAELVLVYDQNVDGLLNSLASYLPTDTLREFMDDLAMGRV